MASSFVIRDVGNVPLTVEQDVNGNIVLIDENLTTLTITVQED